MLLKRIGLFIAVIIVLMLTYQYGTTFASDPKTLWFLGVIAAILIYCAKLLYDDYNRDLLTERQYSGSFKQAVEMLSGTDSM